MFRAWLAIAVVLGLAGTAVPGLAAGEVTVEGNRFYRDGAPWVAEGVTLVGLVSPAGRVANKPTYAAARAAFGSGMLGEVRRFGADTVRFQVSQTGLDPKSKDHDPGYRDEVLDAVAMTRDAGLNVILSMQWQGVSGRRGEGLPTGATRRACAPRVRRTCSWSTAPSSRAILPGRRRSTTRSGSSATRCIPTSAGTTRRGRSGRRSGAASPGPIR